LGNKHFHIDFGSDCFHIPRMPKPIRSHQPPTQTRGRPREFDLSDAVDLAIPVFCERGFNGTSINDLASAMQLTVGSIYKAFKDKRGVFLAALDRDAELRDRNLRGVVDAATSGREKVLAALMFYVELSHGAVGLQGCLTIGTAVDLTTSDPEIAQRAAGIFQRREASLVTLLKRGQEDGSVPEGVDCAGAARFLLCLLQGLRVVGKTGRSREELQAAVEAAMKALD
jgi:AcrR family transcriptional regulator